MDKRAWRRRLRAERARSVIDHAGHVRSLGRFLADVVPAGRCVVVYDALPDEVALDGLVRAHPEPGERYALTRTPDDGHRLTVHPLDGATEQHPYGYHQPVADGPVVADADIGAVLVPGLGFDRNGNRLGRGGGYYDRFLARLDPSVIRLGITGGLVVDRLPVDDHDVAMTHLALADAVLDVPLDRSSSAIRSW